MIGWGLLLHLSEGVLDTGPRHIFERSQPILCRVREGAAIIPPSVSDRTLRSKAWKPIFAP